MKKGGIGGSKTAKNGQKYEEKVDYLYYLSKIDGYSIVEKDDNTEIYYNGKFLGLSIKKGQIYKYLEKEKVDWKNIISKKLLPDEAILNIDYKTLYIIEIKHQETEGSVDEKLQTCDFKRKQFQKLMSPLEIKVEYIYILNDWFRKDRYKDVKEYIKQVGCKFYFNSINPEDLNLPNSPINNLK